MHFTTVIASSAIVLALAAAAAPAYAGDDAEPPRRQAAAARREGDLAIDGKLDDAAWAAAPWQGDFWQRSPDEGAAMPQVTQFRVLYDARALYVAIRCDDPDAGKIRGLLTRRDEWSASDWVTVAIDSYADHRTAFMFMLNAAGVQRDLLIFDDTQEDASWDAVWSGAAQRDAAGWSAELRIPLGQLRFATTPEPVWGLQVQRIVARDSAQAVWSPSPRASGRFVSNFGELRGLRDVSPGRRLELIPYVSAGVDLAPDETSAFRDTAEPRGGLGLDLRYGLGSSLTLAATINPDFGQVEADPSQVNLSANELRLPEQRPFFLDGIDLFQAKLSDAEDNGEALFYSRRIGAAPHRRLDFEAPDADAPTSTTIYGAAKLSGKTAGGWSVGVLDAVTGEESGQYVDGAGATQGAVVEPLTNYALVKVGRDLRGGRTALSAIATSVERRLDGTSLSGVLHDRALAGGVTATHRFADDEWTLAGRAFGSYVEGKPEAIARTQLQPRHLFQRPDAPHLTFDPTRTSLDGAAASVMLTRSGGDGPIYGGVGGEARSPEFEVNDMGFQQGGDLAIAYAFMSVRDTVPGKLVLQSSLNVNAYAASDFAPWLSAFGGNINGSALFKNFWSVNGGVAWDKNRWDFVALRGGPGLRDSQTTNGWLGVSTDERRDLIASASGSGFYRAADESWQLGGDASLSWQVRPNVALAVSAGFEVRSDARQFVAGAVDTSGAPHYVLARIDQRTGSATLRGSWTFTPQLSLQVYAQPFISSGAYGEFKDAVAPGSADPAQRFVPLGGADLSLQDGVYVAARPGQAPFAFGQPDFNFRELNASAVLRWQYRPGSTVYAIWSHGRSSVDGDGTLRLGDSLAALGDVAGGHVVMVKATYWFGL